MGLSLLVPAFLLGLLALAIPIWVHLRDRPHRESMEFPSLMFLERVPHRAEQRQVLRNRALLALRLVALGLIALAFARPFLGGVEVPASFATGSRDVVLVLDRSASMGYGDRWSRAMAASRQVLDELGSGDRVALVLFDDEPVVAAPWTADHGAVRGALQTVTVGAGGTRLAAGLRAAGEMLGTSRGSNEVVLISDFARRGWDGAEQLSLPPGTVLRPFSVASTGDTDNRAVAEVRPSRAAADPSILTVSARLTRAGGQSPVRVTATLRIDGGPSESLDVELSPDSATTVQFAPIAGLADPLRGTVSLEADLLAADDSLYFVTAPGQVVRVLLLEHPAAASGGFFVTRALGVGVRPAFQVRREPLGDLRSSDLAEIDVVVLNDAGEVDVGSAQTLAQWVQAGGGLLVAAGELTPRVEIDDTGEPRLVPALGAPADRNADLGASVAYLDTRHPALELFAAAGNGELAGPRFYTYRPLQPPPAEGVLARFDDGSAALVERSLGQGRVLSWIGTLDNYWSDFPTHPVFVPFLHELVKYAAHYREPQPWLPAGRPLARGELVGGGDADGDGAVVIDGTRAQLPVRLAPGFHTVEDGAGVPRVVAANVDRGEGDSGTVDPEEVAAAVVEQVFDDAPENPDTGSAEQLRERRQSLWWFLMILGFALLAAETVLSNRRSVRAS